VGGSFFVDCHSHVVPAGDDGVATVAEGRDLCLEAARRGTRVLFATPHVWPHLLLPREREAQIRTAHAAVATRAGLELRLGFELTPMPLLLDEDPGRYRLEGTDFVLMEVPFVGPLEDLLALAEHVEASGLRPLIAHPERGEAVQADPERAVQLAERGWLLQVNATSLLGRHGADAESLGWAFLEDGIATVVGSDGHRAARPPYLDEAYTRALARLGEGARSVFDGAALGLAAAMPLGPSASEIALPGA
jgi:protein-tyrosine phosphatase